MNKIVYKILWWTILNLEVQKKKSGVYFHLRWYKVSFQVSFNLDKTKNIGSLYQLIWDIICLISTAPQI